MIVLITGIVFAIAAVAMFLLRQQSKSVRYKRPQQGKPSTGKRRKAQTPSGPYAAVSVKPSNSSCSAAFETTNLRYLKSAAPSLPVEGCNSADCRCSFINHLDRRDTSDDDRRMGIGLQTQLYGSNGERNRRESRRGRRAKDRHSLAGY
ncbi:MAG: hypothetical protein ACI8RN_001482 [Glaciecola sp.]|jgi:hypothetical protein|uniref:hypothetical protein n=1 Tax=Congregibacter sp. TaxID=2744308 RepID=UPI0039E61733